jgi:CBS domain-containing protein
MKVRDVMVERVSRCSELDRIDMCSRLMRDRRVGLLPVINLGGRVVGVVTDRDIALRVVAGNRPGSTLVRDVMTHGPVVTVTMGDELSELESRLAKAHKRRAVVVDSAGRCVGIVSLWDIAQKEEPARTVMLLREVSRNHG